MTRSRRLVQLWRLMLLCICCSVALIVIDQSDHGLNVGTSLSEMVPETAGNRLKTQAMRQAQDIAEQGITLMLESAGADQLNEATLFVQKRIDAAPQLLHRNDAALLSARIVEQFAGNRFHLLSPSDRALLIKKEYTEILDSALTDLYSPGGKLRLLSLQRDPFNFFGSYLENGLSATRFNATQASAASQHVFRQMINIRLLTPIAELEEQSVLADFFKSLELAVSVQYPTVRLLRSGVLFFSNEAATQAKKDINLISSGSGIGLFLLLLVVFRSAWPLVTTLLSILVGVVFAFAVVVWSYGSIHVFTIVFGASLIGIVIDYSIHYFYHQAMADSAPEIHAGAARGDSLHRALLLSLLTSVVGFSALMLSSVVMLQKIAVFSVCGITASWVTVMAVAPLAPAQAVSIRRSLIAFLLHGISTLVVSVSRLLSRRIVVLSMIGMAACTLWFSKGQDDPRQFIELSSTLLRESAEINSNVSGLEPGRFLLVEARNEQEMFNRLQRLYNEVGADARMISVYDWLPSPSTQRQNYELLRPVYASAGLAEKLYASLGVDAAEENTLYAEFVGSANSVLSSEQFFAALQPGVSSLVMPSERSYIGYVLIGSGANLARLAAIATQLPGVDYVDSVVDSTEQLRQQRQSAMGILAFAYLVVGAMMLLIYRHWRVLLMLAVPLCSTIVTLFTLLVLGESLTIFHAMALFLILGLGMDYVVFLNEMTIDREATLQAILLSALTSMLSFGLLALSSVPVAQAFGLTVFIGNTLNLLATIALASQRQPAVGSRSFI